MYRTVRPLSRLNWSSYPSFFQIVKTFLILISVSEIRSTGGVSCCLLGVQYSGAVINEQIWVSISDDFMQDDDFTQLHIVSSILIENDLGVFPIPLKLSQLQPVLACAICEREGSTSTSPPRP